MKKENILENKKICQKGVLENKVSFLELLSKKKKQKYIDLKPLKSQKTLNSLQVKI